MVWPQSEPGHQLCACPTLSFPPVPEMGFRKGKLSTEKGDWQWNLEERGGD